MNWYLTVWKKYAVFAGRARRKEYWFFVLFNIIAMMALAFIDGMMGSLDPETGIGILSAIYVLAVLIPSLAVGIRRLHDTGRSGWWMLLALIPIAGLVLLIFMIFDSQVGDNAYGPNPKGAEA